MSALFTFTFRYGWSEAGRAVAVEILADARAQPKAERAADKDFDGMYMGGRGIDWTTTRRDLMKRVRVQEVAA